MEREQHVDSPSDKVSRSLLVLDADQRELWTSMHSEVRRVIDNQRDTYVLLNRLRSHQKLLDALDIKATPLSRLIIHFRDIHLLEPVKVRGIKGTPRVGLDAARQVAASAGRFAAAALNSNSKIYELANVDPDHLIEHTKALLRHVGEKEAIEHIDSLADLRGKVVPADTGTIIFERKEK